PNAAKPEGFFLGGFRGSERLRRTNREDDIHTKLDELRGELRKTLLPAFRVAPLNEEVLAFDVAELAKPLLECREKVWAAGRRAGFNVPDLDDPRRLLCACRERPRN